MCIFVFLESNKGYLNIGVFSVSIKTRSSDGSFLAISSTDGYCSFVTFEDDELGIPLKEKPVLITRTPNTAEKKTKKGQSPSVTSPVPKPVEGTPPQRTIDSSSPIVPGKTPIGSKDLPSTPVSVRNIPPSSSEERKSMQPSSHNPKGNQPRRITLNTLQAWSKTPR